MDAEKAQRWPDRRLPVRRGALPARRRAARRERLPLPHVPEGGRRAVHGLRRRPARPTSSGTRGDADDLRQLRRSPSAASARDCGTPLTYRDRRPRPRQRDDRQPRRSRRRRAEDAVRRRIASRLARRVSRLPDDDMRRLDRPRKSRRRQSPASRSRHLNRARPARRKGDRTWPKPSSTITSARRADAASRTARCTPPRRCISPRPR